MIDNINYKDENVQELFESLNLEVDTFKDYLKRLNNVNLALVEEYGGNLKCEVVIKENKIRIWYSWDTDIYKNDSAFKVGTSTREESFLDFFESLALTINPIIGFKIYVDFENEVKANGN